jgi:hypothetical protein
VLNSVTLIAQKSTFDPDLVIEQYHSVWQRNPSHKYYNKTKEEILKIWNNVKNHGTEKSLFIPNNLEPFE